MIVAIFAFGLAGLLIGSFLNVVAWRLPRGESLMRPGSACPVCRAPIKPYDNVPVLSWLVLRGRCRHCGARISGRYPAVELTTAVLYIAVALGRDGALEIALGLLLVTALVPIALIDLDRPDPPHRPRPPDHPQRDPPPGRRRRHRRRGRHRHRLRARAADRRPRRGWLLPARRAALSARHGDGRREARRGPGPLPGARRRAGDPHRARQRGRRRRGDHRPQGRPRGPEDRRAVRALPGARRRRGAVRRRRARRRLPRHVLTINPRLDGCPVKAGEAFSAAARQPMVAVFPWQSTQSPSSALTSIRARSRPHRSTSTAASPSPAPR